MKIIALRGFYLYENERKGSWEEWGERKLEAGRFQGRALIGVPPSPAASIKLPHSSRRTISTRAAGECTGRFRFLTNEEYLNLLLNILFLQ